MAPLEIVYEVPPGLYQRAFRAYLWRKVGGFAIGAALALLLAAAVAPSEPWLSDSRRARRRLPAQPRAAAAQRGKARASTWSWCGDAAYRRGGSGLQLGRGDWKVLRRNIRAVRRIGEVVELDLGSSEPPVWIPAQAVSGVPFARLQELAGGTAGAPS
jgi:hypothetical protein